MRTRSIYAIFASVVGLTYQPGVLAQSVTISGSGVLNASDCDNATTVTVDFTAPTESSTSTPKIALFATTNDCPTVDSTATGVSVPSGAISLVSVRSLTSTDQSGNSATLQATALAQDNCAAIVTLTWNVCLYEFWTTAATTTSSSTDTNTSTSVQVTYNSAPPGPPVLTGIVAGDQHLVVSFSTSDNTDVTGYFIRVIPKSTDLDAAIEASAQDAGSGRSSYNCYDGAEETSVGTNNGSVRVPDSNGGGLTDGLTYVVQVRAENTAGNYGPCSNPLDGTPEMVDDFWIGYKKAGGSAEGCNQAPGGMPTAAIVGPVLMRLWRRRRRLNLRPQHIVSTSVGCPFCSWESSATAVAYLQAQARVVNLLLAHLDDEHAERAGA